MDGIVTLIVPLCDDYSSRFNARDWVFTGNGMISGYGHGMAFKACGHGTGSPDKQHYFKTWDFINVEWIRIYQGIRV